MRKGKKLISLWLIFTDFHATRSLESVRTTLNTDAGRVPLIFLLEEFNCKSTVEMALQVSPLLTICNQSIRFICFTPSSLLAAFVRN